MTDHNYPVTDLNMYPDAKPKLRMFSVTLTQSRVTEYMARTEGEAIEGALAEWAAEAPAFDPDVTDITVRDASPEEAIYNGVGLT